MSDPTPRIRIPDTAAAGETIVIRTLISHPMESGQRRDAAGNVLPRKIINRFTVEFEGELVIDAALEPAVSANPYFEIEAVVPRSGAFTFTWVDDDGAIYRATETVTVA
jgi:sulfur-oxidizing protein SoxZ